MGNINITEGVDSNISNTSLITKVISYSKKNYKAIAIVALIVFLGSAYIQQLQANSDLKKSQSSTTNNTQTAAINLRNSVSKLMELPTSEIPTIATVTDVAKLHNQAFFTNAEDGDKVLIFSKAKEVILYRPSVDKIIQVAPLSGNATSSTSSK